MWPVFVCADHRVGGYVEHPEENMIRNMFPMIVCLSLVFAFGADADAKKKKKRKGPPPTGWQDVTDGNRSATIHPTGMPSTKSIAV